MANETDNNDLTNSENTSKSKMNEVLDQTEQELNDIFKGKKSTASDSTKSAKIHKIQKPGTSGKTTSKTAAKPTKVQPVKTEPVVKEKQEEQLPEIKPIEFETDAIELEPIEIIEKKEEPALIQETPEKKEEPVSEIKDTVAESAPVEIETVLDNSIFEQILGSDFSEKTAENTDAKKEEIPEVKEEALDLVEIPITEEAPVKTKVNADKDKTTVEEEPVFLIPVVDDEMPVRKEIKEAVPEKSQDIPVEKPAKKEESSQTRVDAVNQNKNAPFVEKRQETVKKRKPIENRTTLPSGLAIGSYEKIVASYRAFKTVETNRQGIVTVTNRRLIIEEEKTSEMPISDVAGIKFSTSKFLRMGMIILTIVLIVIGAALAVVGYKFIPLAWAKWLVIGLGAISAIIGLILISKWVKKEFAFSVYCREIEFFESYKSLKKIKDGSVVEPVVKVIKDVDTDKMLKEIGAIIVDIKEGLYDD